MIEWKQYSKRRLSTMRIFTLLQNLICYDEPNKRCYDEQLLKSLHNGPFFNNFEKSNFKIYFDIVQKFANLGQGEP
jgi:hypothetical protein